MIRKFGTHPGSIKKHLRSVIESNNSVAEFCEKYFQTEENRQFYTKAINQFVKLTREGLMTTDFLGLEKEPRQTSSPITDPHVQGISDPLNESYEFEAPVLHIGSDSEEEAPENIKTVDVTDDYEVRTPSPLPVEEDNPQSVFTGVIKPVDLHWSFEDTKISNEGKLVIKRSDLASSTIDGINVKEQIPEMKSSDLIMNKRIVLEYQTHAEWQITVFERVKNYVAIFTTSHVIFCPVEIKLPFKLVKGYNFKFKMFPDKRTGKLFLPDQLSPAKLNEVHYTYVEDLENFTNLFLNKQNLQERTTLFKISTFESLTHMLEM